MTILRVPHQGLDTLPWLNGRFPGTIIHKLGLRGRNYTPQSRYPRQASAAPFLKDGEVAVPECSMSILLFMYLRVLTTRGKFNGGK